MPQSFMDDALAEARAAQAADEVPVGCVIVRDGAVIARAGNRTLRDRDPTAHAEMLAIRQAAAALGSERLTDCDLYVTLEPCAMCAAAISFARIRRLYYGAADPKGGAVENGVRFFASPTCHHRPEVYGGIGESEAAALLQGFLQSKALSFSFTSALIGSAARRIALAWKKSSMRKMPMFGRSTRSGAPCLSFSRNDRVAHHGDRRRTGCSHGSGTPCASARRPRRRPRR